MKKTVKRIISLALSLALCSALLLPASAASPEANSKAAALKQLGLFMGVSDTEFELDRAPTRVEALVMLLRTLGKEKEAKASTASHPFTDVPDWADRYVAYAYDKGLTKGVSETSFGAEDASADMYITFILRALGYDDAAGDFVWDAAKPFAKNVGILPDSVNTASFMRADVVLVSWASLSAKLKGESRTLSEKLISDNVFTSDAYVKAAASLNAVPGSVAVRTPEELTSALADKSIKDIYIVGSIQGPFWPEEEITIPEGVTVTVGLDASLFCTMALTNNGTLRVVGSDDISDVYNYCGIIKIMDGATFVNNGSIVLEAPTRLDFDPEDVMGGGLLINESHFENKGSLLIKSCKTSALGGWVQVFMGSFTNDGTVTLESGNINIFCPLDNYKSTFINNAGATVVNNGEISVQGYGSFTGSGTFTGNPVTEKAE